MGIHELYSELAVGLVRATTDESPSGELVSRRGFRLYSIHPRVLYDACDALVRVGVAYWDRDPLPLGCERLAIDAADVRRFMIDRSRGDMARLPNIDDLISTWLSWADHRGFVSPQRVPFNPEGPIDELIHELVELGYARRIGASVLWTDKIGAAMQKACIWNSNNVSYAEVDELELDEEAQAAFESIPDDVRHAALRNDSLSVARAIADRWVGGRWIDAKKESHPLVVAGAASDVARHLVNQVKNASSKLSKN